MGNLLVTPKQIETVINIHIQTQKNNPPDSVEAVAAVTANRSLFSYCKDMGWKYNTDNGYLTVIA